MFSDISSGVFINIFRHSVEMIQCYNPNFQSLKMKAQAFFCGYFHQLILSVKMLT